MSEYVAELNEIYLRRGSKHILRNISWCIEHGQHWVLLGANGSGKTMLLKILTGYLWPTSGTVAVFGETFGKCDIPKLRKTVGYVTSANNDAVPPGDTAMDVVLSGIDASFGVYRSFDVDEIDCALEAISVVSASGYAHQSFATLSQGQKQRILIARALVCKPKLLILDEPCVGLDPVARGHFLSDVAAMSEQQDAPSIIFVTHHVEEIAPPITHALLIKDGRAIAQGSVSDTINSDSMTELFAAPCDVKHESGKWSLTVKETG